MEKKYVIGVDLGGTKIYTALVDLQGNMKKEVIVETEAEKGELPVLQKMIDTIDYVLEGTNKDEVKAIGIGSPGPLDVANGLIVYTPNLPFKNFNIVKPIKERYGIETFLDNDANVATLGEFMLEIGHMTLMNGGPRCGCGNTGCAESLASGTAIMNRGREAAKSNCKTSLKNYETITSKEVFQEAAKGDKEAKRIIDNALNYLGITFANAANIFDPDCFVLSGSMAQFVDSKKMEEYVNNDIVTSPTSIRLATTGNYSGMIGAALLAFDEVNNG